MAAIHRQLEKLRTRLVVSLWKVWAWAERRPT